MSPTLRLPGRRAAAAGLVLALAALAAVFAASASSRSTAAPRDTLIVLQAEVAPSLDPDGPDASDPGLWLGFRNTYEPLVGYPYADRGGILVPNYKVSPTQFTPKLAQSYSHKGLVWTFRLRKGVTSCAGNELTADDVVYTFARAKSVSGASPVAWFLSNVGSVLPVDPVLPNAKPAAKQLHGEVTKVDKYTVQIKQTAPNELWPRVAEVFALDIFDSKEMRKHATAADPWSHNFTTQTGAAGFGPYCVSRWNKGSEIDFTWNPKYYGGKPQFTKIIVRKVPASGSRIASIRTGAADVVTDLAPNEYNQLRGDSGVSVLGSYNNQQAGLSLNFAIPPWGLPGNEKLRQAVAYAIPYDSIINSVFKGHARRAPGVSFIPLTYRGAKAFNIYSTNLAKAKQLLAAAGYPGGKGLEKYKSALSLYYPAERATIVEPVVNQIRTGLAKVGINITLNPISLAQFSNRYQQKRDLPMALIDFGAAFGPDASYTFQLNYVTNGKGSVANSSNYSNPKFDTLVGETLKATGAKRLALEAQGQAILIKELAQIPVYEFETTIAVKKGLTGWLQTTDNSLSFFQFKQA